MIDAENLEEHFVELHWAVNDMAIKVSQDGTIKVFLNGRDKAIKF